MNIQIKPQASLVRREHSMKFGPQILPEGVRFRLWAPKLDHVGVRIAELDRSLDMKPMPDGWFELTVADAAAGMHYQFVLPDGLTIADPVSRYLPGDVDGASQIIDPLAFAWTDEGWQGRPWHESIFYEVHIGAFTREGTFRAAIEKLDHVASLGANTIEIMPIGDFKGRWNWGYDGASLFAPDASYGTPEDFKAFVNAAHDKGISVVLDVVYNHFGPKGNYLHLLGPLYQDEIETPWGPAVNFDAASGATVRELVIDNALYWLKEFNLDGLRFDAVHEIYDDGPLHVLEELTERVRATFEDRHVHLISENSLNHVDWLTRNERNEPWRFDAQWSDDLHHALHALITEENCWYYADFEGRTDLAGRALAEGVSWQGEYMEHEQRNKGEPSAFLPATAFVSFMQNHDQMGNRPHGDRVSGMVSAEALRLWSAIVLLSPEIPLLFMGEEWAATTPYLFFSDVGEDLADTIRKSRVEELKRFPNVSVENLPDPMSQASFVRSKLDWSEPESGQHASMLEHYRELIAVRSSQIIPRLAGMAGYSAEYEVLDDKVIAVRWTLGDGSHLHLAANLRDAPAEFAGLAERRIIWLQGDIQGTAIGGWSCVFSLEE